MRRYSEAEWTGLSKAQRSRLYKKLHDDVTAQSETYLRRFGHLGGVSTVFEDSNGAPVLTIRVRRAADADHAHDEFVVESTAKLWRGRRRRFREARRRVGACAGRGMWSRRSDTLYALPGASLPRHSPGRRHRRRVRLQLSAHRGRRRALEGDSNTRESTRRHRRRHTTPASSARANCDAVG